MFPTLTLVLMSEYLGVPCSPASAQVCWHSSSSWSPCVSHGLPFLSPPVPVVSLHAVPYPQVPASQRPCCRARRGEDNRAGWALDKQHPRALPRRGLMLPRIPAAPTSALPSEAAGCGIAKLGSHRRLFLLYRPEQQCPLRREKQMVRTMGPSCLPSPLPLPSPLLASREGAQREIGCDNQ